MGEGGGGEWEKRDNVVLGFEWGGPWPGFDLLWCQENCQE